MPSVDDCSRTAPPPDLQGWLECIGINGWLLSESPAALRRNTHFAINTQKCRRCVCYATGGPPNERILLRNTRSDRGRPAIPPFFPRVLRRSIEFTLHAMVATT